MSKVIIKECREYDFGCVRFVYNKMLADRQQAYEQSKVKLIFKEVTFTYERI